VAGTNGPRQGASKSGAIVGWATFAALVSFIVAFAIFLVVDNSHAKAEFERDAAAMRTAVQEAGWELASEPHTFGRGETKTGPLFATVKFGDCPLQVRAEPDDPTNVRMLLGKADVALKAMSPAELKQNAERYQLGHCIPPTG
jgi:hypothetical protein